MKMAIILGTLIPTLVYLLFIVGVLALTAGAPSKDVVTDFSLLPGYARSVIGGLGFIAILTSYIFLGLELKSVLRKDFGLSPNFALAGTVLPPLLLYLSGRHDLIALIAVAGGIFIAIESSLVVLMWEKVKSKKLFINRIIIAIFVSGAIYEIWKRIG
jgi:hypothetical protein